MTLYTRKFCITATPSTPFSVDYYILHFDGKTLETVNVSLKSQSFIPCTKVEMYFVEITIIRSPFYLHLYGSRLPWGSFYNDLTGKPIK